MDLASIILGGASSLISLAGRRPKLFGVKEKAKQVEEEINRLNEILRLAMRGAFQSPFVPSLMAGASPAALAAIIYELTSEEDFANRLLRELALGGGPMVDLFLPGFADRRNGRVIS